MFYNYIIWSNIMVKIGKLNNLIQNVKKLNCKAKQIKLEQSKAKLEAKFELKQPYSYYKYIFLIIIFDWDNINLF